MQEPYYYLNILVVRVTIVSKLIFQM